MPFTRPNPLPSCRTRHPAPRPRLTFAQRHGLPADARLEDDGHGNVVAHLGAYWGPTPQPDPPADTAPDGYVPIHSTPRRRDLSTHPLPVYHEPEQPRPRGPRAWTCLRCRAHATAPGSHLCPTCRRREAEPLVRLSRDIARIARIADEQRERDIARVRDIVAKLPDPLVNLRAALGLPPRR